VLSLPTSPAGSARARAPADAGSAQVVVGLAT
jgi:hypothetical protein